MERSDSFIKLKGDKVIEQVPSLKDKAMRINFNENIYGTFAEIGAGQETVRHFFRAGGSSGTIAKAMSAYDKDFSDAIYGVEDDGRYVTEGRLKNMLKHEVELIEKRLSRDKHPNKLFFSYANTVSTIDFAKQFKGHGWVGIKYQVEAEEDYNEITLHIRFKENDARLQQETLGVLGVNLIFGAFYKIQDVEEAVFAGGKHQIRAVRNDRGRGSQVLVAIVVLRHGMPVRVAERDEPVRKRKRSVAGSGGRVLQLDYGFGEIGVAVKVRDRAVGWIHDVAAVAGGRVNVALPVRRLRTA